MTEEAAAVGPRGRRIQLQVRELPEPPTASGAREQVLPCRSQREQGPAGLGAAASTAVREELSVAFSHPVWGTLLCQA